MIALLVPRLAAAFPDTVPQGESADLACPHAACDLAECPPGVRARGDTLVLEGTTPPGVYAVRCGVEPVQIRLLRIVERWRIDAGQTENLPKVCKSGEPVLHQGRTVVSPAGGFRALKPGSYSVSCDAVPVGELVVAGRDVEVEVPQRVRLESSAFAGAGWPMGVVFEPTPTLSVGVSGVADATQAEVEIRCSCGEWHPPGALTAKKCEKGNTCTIELDAFPYGEHPLTVEVDGKDGSTPAVASVRVYVVPCLAYRLTALALGVVVGAAIAVGAAWRDATSRVTRHLEEARAGVQFWIDAESPVAAEQLEALRDLQASNAAKDSTWKNLVDEFNRHRHNPGNLRVRDGTLGQAWRAVGSSPRSEGVAMSRTWLEDLRSLQALGREASSFDQLLGWSETRSLLDRLTRLPGQPRVDPEVWGMGWSGRVVGLSMAVGTTAVVLGAKLGAWSPGGREDLLLLAAANAVACVVVDRAGVGRWLLRRP